MTKFVDPSRLAHGEHEGDIAASYSADRISEGAPVRKPFSFEGFLWTATGSHGDEHQAVRILPASAFTGTPTTYREKVRGNAEESDYGESARNDPNGFYHGMTVKHGGKPFILVGPPAIFLPTGTPADPPTAEARGFTIGGWYNTAPPISGEADVERESKLDAERCTLQFGRPSSKPLDAGRKPIDESPLFGGQKQGDLFE